ncbi:MAG: cytochrome b/b6 domain-containing protein [Nevskia sp.]|nr:cytochrome b/b6 domain-containing protein [Nevskia sp.]
MTKSDPAPVYGTVARLLHWLVFVLLAAQFAIAWTMPHIGRNARPEGLIAWHLWLGMLILLLAALRLGWRLRHPAPPAPAGQPAWQRRLARAVHGLLYAILILLPLLGWANACARPWDVSLFGVVPLPRLLEKGSHFGRSLGGIHSNLAIVLLVVLGLHVAATLYHQFVARDGTLMRMLPRGKS